MSAEDLKYVEKVTNRQKSRSGTLPSEAAPRRPIDDDDLPLRAAQPQPKPKKPTVDWFDFDFFLNAGCELDDCTRYANSFERDKIDEAVLLDIIDYVLRIQPQTDMMR
jgi:hypothetical protein